MTFAQRFIPVEVSVDYMLPQFVQVIMSGQLWVPFFNAVQFTLGVSTINKVGFSLYSFFIRHFSTCASNKLH